MRILILLLAAGLAHAQRVPVLAELFTSEGCSSCPPADQLLQQLDKLQPVPAAQILVLSEHVDYWDQLGWRDPFSQPLFTAREELYARRLGGEVYTPQLVIDGREKVLGNDPRAVGAAIEHAAKKPKAPLLVTAKRDSDAVITVSGEGRGDLWVAIADEADRSEVKRGENSGRALAHVAVVRSLGKAGKFEGGEKTFRTPVRPDASRVVVFLTDGGGAVTGAAMTPLP